MEFQSLLERDGLKVEVSLDHTIIRIMTDEKIVEFSGASLNEVLCVSQAIGLGPAAKLAVNPDIAEHFMNLGGYSLKESV